MKPRIRDIARQAGVSAATVSNALNGRNGVSKAVSQQIIALAKDMGYESTKVHAGPEQRYVRFIVYKSHGMVVMDTQFFSELIESVQMECQRAGFNMVISHVNASEGRDFEQRIRGFCNEECAGILLLGTEMSAGELKNFADCRSPLVVIDNLFRHENVHSVVMNNYDSGYTATQTLYAWGHRQIGHITSSVGFSNMRYRRKGYEAAMAETGTAVTAEDLWAVQPNIEGAYHDMRRYLAQGRKVPTAFFAGNDLMAVGAVRALQEEGYRVPEDVSMIGMDDTSVCLACTPALSTMHVYRQKMGMVAVHTLLRLSGQMEDCVIKTELGVSLVMRDSVKDLRTAETAKQLNK